MNTDPATRKLFSTKHLRLAQNCVNRTMNAAGIKDALAIGIEPADVKDDLMQEALIAMNKAYKTYDEKHKSNAKLETYLYICVKNKVNSELKRMSKKHQNEELTKSSLLILANEKTKYTERSMAEPLLDCLIADLAKKAAPFVRYVTEEELKKLLKALSEYDIQKSAAESVGISKDMAKHIMKDLRQYLAEHPDEQERLKRSLTGGV